MAELLEKMLCELVRNSKHLYDVTLPGHRGQTLLQNSWEEIGQELNVSWMVAKEKWRSVQFASFLMYIITTSSTIAMFVVRNLWCRPQVDDISMPM